MFIICYIIIIVLTSCVYLLSLLSRDARALITRVVDAYNEYFGKIPDDRLLAFFANPLFVTVGSAVLKALLDDPVIVAGVPPINTEGSDLVDKAKELFHAHVKHFVRGKFKEGEQSPGSGNEDVAEGLCILLFYIIIVIFI